MALFVNSLVLAALAFTAPSDEAADRVSTSFDLEAWSLKRAVLKEEAHRLAVAFTNFTARAAQPSEDAAVPLETHPDGSVKLKIEAKKACVFVDEGYVLGSDVSIFNYAEDGSETTRIDAKECLIDRTTKSGWAQGAARFRHGKTVFTGEDLFFSSPEQYLMAFRRLQIDSADMLSGAALEGKMPTAVAKTSLPTHRPAGESVKIRSRAGDFDRAENVVVFEGAVQVDYVPDYQMTGENLYAFLDGDGLNRLVAFGNVTLTNDVRSGTCDRVVFRRKTGEIEMYGKTGGDRAHLEEAAGNAVDGRCIKFWLDGEQVEVVDSVLTIKTQGKGELKKL